MQGVDSVEGDEGDGDDSIGIGNCYRQLEG